MNTLGLGRQVNTLGLGAPYGVVIPPTGGGGGGGAFHGRYEKPYDYTESDRKYEEQLRRQRIKREDDEVTEFIVSLLSKGIL